MRCGVLHVVAAALAGPLPKRPGDKVDRVGSVVLQHGALQLRCLGAGIIGDPGLLVKVGAVCRDSLKGNVDEVVFGGMCGLGTGSPVNKVRAVGRGAIEGPAVGLS